MKIRDKLFLGFGLYVLLAAVLGFFAYKELRTITTRLSLVETADDITSTILEVRRYEKNYLLFKDQDNLSELRNYLALLKKNIDNIKSEITEKIGVDHYGAMKKNIVAYEQLINGIVQNFTRQKRLVDAVRNEGRRIEQKLAGRALESFLVLRRHEKNLIIDKNQTAYDTFRKTLTSSGLGDSRDINRYTLLMAGLFSLYKEEKNSIDTIRSSAREIQSFTENLSKRERLDIGTTLTMSMNLLLYALLAIVLVGTVINIKLATSIATPVRTLEKISRKIAQGDFSERIEVKGKDELASLEIAFNHMEEKLKNALWSLEHAIGRLREKQAQLVEAEKLAAVGKLAAGIAHEINNPLTSVLTFSNLMLEQCPEDDPRHDKLKMMARETERARNIVRQLLNFGREVNIKTEKININHPVRSVIDSLVAQEAFKGLGLSVNLSDDLPEVDADREQISQVVVNLVLNAIHAVTPPGLIEVTTRTAKQSVELTVRDSGSGIPEKHLNKIFDPFFTTKDVSKGTGLGLAVSYGIIKKHGGDIEVRSEVGKGSTFIVRLPLHG